MDAVVLLSYLSQLLRPHLGDDVRHAPSGPCLLRRDYPWILARTDLHLPGEHHRRRWRAADDGRPRPLDGRDLDVLRESPGEDDERAAVVAGDDAEDDRPLEVHDRPADLRAVLELEPSHRLGRSVEAGEIREDDERPGAAPGIVRPGEV